MHADRFRGEHSRSVIRRDDGGRPSRSRVGIRLFDQRYTNPQTLPKKIDRNEIL